MNAVTLISDGIFLENGNKIVTKESVVNHSRSQEFDETKAAKETMAYRIMMAHQTSEGMSLYVLNLMHLHRMILRMWGLFRLQ